MENKVSKQITFLEDILSSLRMQKAELAYKKMEAVKNDNWSKVKEEITSKINEVEKNKHQITEIIKSLIEYNKVLDGEA